MPRHGDKVLIAGLVPPVIVYFFQVIHVEEDHEGIAAGRKNFVAAGNEAFPVAQTGQAVMFLLPQHFPEMGKLRGNVGKAIQHLLFCCGFPENKPPVTGRRPDDQQRLLSHDTFFEPDKLFVIKDEAVCLQQGIQPAYGVFVKTRAVNVEPC